MPILRWWGRHGGLVGGLSAVSFWTIYFFESDSWDINLVGGTGWSIAMRILLFLALAGLAVDIVERVQNRQAD